MINNVAILGHSHPGVAVAVARQLRLLNTNSRFHYDIMVRFAERLTALLPAPLDTVFLVSTGSEANDLALRLIRIATGQKDVLSVRSAYHGWTTATDEVSTSLVDHPGAAETRPPWVHAVLSPNTYRGPFRGPDAAERYADDVRATLARIQGQGRGVAGFIAEALYGNAGGLVLPDGYLQAVYALVREAGGLCIADEVQVGYGRLGTVFWGFEQQSVVPDVVTVAKAAGNGYPVGAVITTRAIADSFAREGSFFSSVGGSPASSAAGLAVLDALEAEGLQANAREVGAHLKARLQCLVERHPICGAVHGLGLYLGLELVRDRTTLEPATAEAAAICERMRECGVVVQPTSDHMNVLKIKPPLCITRASADFFVETLDHVLTHGW
jgi:4-aminobutyrate aminotransferase-like enzyme